MRSSLQARLALLAGVLWLSYTLHGFRPPWQPLVESDGDVGSSIRQIYFLGTSAFIGYVLLVTNTLPRVLRERFGWVSLVLMLLATAAYSQIPVLTCKRTVVFACGFVTICGLVHLSTQPMRLLLWGTVVTTGVLAWVSLAMTVALPSECWQLATRPGLAGVAGHPNTLGPALAIAWILSLGMQRPSAVGLRSVLRLLQLGLAIALLLTDSIGSFGVAFAGSVVFVMIESSSYRRGGLLIAFLFCLPVLGLEGASLAESALGAVGRDTSMSGRDVLWAEIGREFDKQPLLGAGFGAFWYEGRGREIVGTWNPRQSHNAYLDLSLDLGLFGALAVLALLLVVTWRGWHRCTRQSDPALRRAAASVVAMVLALVLVGAFSESYLLKLDKFQFFVMTWGLLAMDSTHAVRTHRYASQNARA